MDRKLRTALLVLVLTSILSTSGYLWVSPRQSQNAPTAKQLEIKPVQIPSLLKGSSVSPEVLANAANYFISKGESATIEELILFAESETKHEVQFDVHERIGWLCRILYIPKTSPIRPPAFGVLVFPHLSNNLNDWPLYPLARSGETFCVLTQGYVLGGKTRQIGCCVFGTEPIERNETVSDYLKYCSQHGTFRTQRLNVPNRETAISDLTNLIESDLWKSIRWREDQPKFRYDYNGDWFGVSIIKQASTIAADLHSKDRQDQ